MAEQGGSQEKTEEPTERKLSKARSEGQIARSNEVTIAASVICIAAYFFLFGAKLLFDISSIFAGGLVFDKQSVMEPQVAASRIGEAMFEALIAITPLLILAAIVVFACSGIVGGYNFTWKAVQPKASKLNPITGLKRIFSLRSLVELVKAVAKFLLVGGVGSFLIIGSIQEFGEISLMALEPALDAGATIVITSFLISASMLIIIALIDAPYQSMQHHNKMKMSLQEVKDERKQAEGSPEVKRRIRQKQRELSAALMLEAVADADVVITNPTHFAVALAYDPTSDDPPIVLAKGADIIADQIKQRAGESGVPLFASPSLARALFFTTEVGSYIPEALFEAVAVVIAYIFNINSINQAGTGPSRPNPKVPDDLLFDSDGTRTSIVDN